MVTMYAVVFTDDDEASTDHSAHRTEEDAARAGAELAKAKWLRNNGEDGAPFPDHKDDWEAMDLLRCNYEVRLEVEPIQISAAAIVTLLSDHLAQVVEDVDGQGMTFAEVKAAAAGRDPRAGVAQVWEQAHRVDALATKVMELVEGDIADGVVPATVVSFSELHDHVDANMYLEHVGQRWEWPEGDDGAFQALVEETNMVSDLVSARLAARASSVTG